MIGLLLRWLCSNSGGKNSDRVNSLTPRKLSTDRVKRQTSPESTRTVRNTTEYSKSTAEIGDVVRGCKAQDIRNGGLTLRGA